MITITVTGDLHLSLSEGVSMETVNSILAALMALQSSAQSVDSKLDAVIDHLSQAPAAPLATQADLDEIGAGVAAVQALVDNVTVKEDAALNS